MSVPQDELKEANEGLLVLMHLIIGQPESGISPLLFWVVFLDEEPSGALELLGRTFLVDQHLAD